MKLVKILNNNIAIAVNAKGEDVIVMGCGVAFKKKYGYEVDENLIERIFTQSVPELSNKFENLFKEIPLEYLEITDKIISNAKLKLGKNFEDDLYISLTDHIYFTVQRYKKGIMIRNRLLLETKMIYKEEFMVGQETVKLLNDTFQISLPEDEAAFIALHFVNVTLGTSMQETLEITKIVQEIRSIIRTYFKIEFREDSLDYFRLMTHLKFFAQRMVSNTGLSSDYADIQLFEMVKKRYSKSYRCAEKITEFIEKQYHYNVSINEKMYLTIHIERINQANLEPNNTK